MSELTIAMLVLGGYALGATITLICMGWHSAPSEPGFTVFVGLLWPFAALIGLFTWIGPALLIGLFTWIGPALAPVGDSLVALMQAPERFGAWLRRKRDAHKERREQ